MNKSELIDAVAETTGQTKAAVAATLDGLIVEIGNALKRGDTVTVVGFGTFSVRRRAARAGRNPRSGEPMTIAASAAPAFKPGKGLKDAVQ